MAILVVMDSLMRRQTLLLRHKSRTIRLASKCLIADNLTDFKAMVIYPARRNITRAKHITRLLRLIRHRIILRNIKETHIKTTMAARMASSQPLRIRKLASHNKEVQAGSVLHWLSLATHQANRNR